MVSSKRFCQSFIHITRLSQIRTRSGCAALPCRKKREPSITRSFTSLPALLRHSKAPSLGDVTPDGGADFNLRQREFREELVAAQKAKEQQESQLRPCSSSSSSTKSSLFSGPAVPSVGAAAGGGIDPALVATDPTASTSTEAADPVVSLPASVQSESNSERASLFAKSLSSLSPGEASERATTGQNGSKKKSGPLASLIYGTTEGRNLDKELELSFSQVLARGKYVHSIVFHEVKPEKVDEYVELVGGWYPKIAQTPELKVNLVGSWKTEVGDCNTFVHIWEYRRYQGYHASLNSIQKHPDFRTFDTRLKDLITSKRTSLMQEFSFWPTTPPRKLGGLFELRSYTLHPGNLLEWETHWRRGLKARREVMEGVGAWFVQIGDLNTVHHLWQFANLEERKVRREQSWEIEGWGDTVHKTVPLIQTMKSRILIPLPWSPVA